MGWKRVLRENYHQVVFVFVAFLLMVAASCFSLRTVMQNQIEGARRALRIAEANIKSSLREAEAIILSASAAIEQLAKDGAEREGYAQFFSNASDKLLSDEERRLVYRGIYGLVRGDFIDGSGWKPPADYIFSDRPWYLAAREKKGDTAVTVPHQDHRPGNAGDKSRIIISMSREMYGPGRDYIGIVAIDVFLEQLFRNASSLSLAEGGYGVITNGGFDIIAHRDAHLVNSSMLETSKGFEEIANDLREGQDVSGRAIEGEDGARWIVFFRKMYNGWYVGMFAPMKNFYGAIRRFVAMLSALGILMFFALSLALLRLSAKKMRSDEEIRGKSNFLARMSHEIRAPMNAIIGMSELAMHTKDSHSITDYILSIRQSGRDLLSTINDTLDFAKAESSRMDIAPAPYRFSSLLNDVVGAFRMRLLDCPVIFAVNVDNAIPDNMIGDEACVRQVLASLLSNAAKYTRGYISLDIFCVKTGEHNILINFKVSDSGIGIKKRNQERLLVDYTRIGQGTEGIEGTGLGLAVAKNLCEAMGGNISLSSVYGKGSVFVAAIPQTIMDGKAMAEVIEPGKKSVLLYDERQAYRESVARTLESLGVPTTVAADAGEFLHAFSSGEHQFAFVSKKVEDEAISFKKSRTLETNIVLLAGTREASPPKDVSVILMPAFSVPVANVLNSCPSAPKGQNNATAGGAPGIDARISGMDVEKAMDAFGGSKETLFQVLRTYVLHTSALLEKIASPSTETLAEYAITVHGIKGSSSSLYAGEAALRAGELEAASKAGDIAAVRLKNDDFIRAVKRLISGIESFLEKEPGNLGFDRETKRAPDALVLENIRKACELYDSYSIERSIAELERFAYEEKGELVLWIREQFDDLEYDLIRERLDGEIGKK
jgi:signal transduction histidine kinase/HPt (histidine-containing phosphotransfer) domain-containing protein